MTIRGLIIVVALFALNMAGALATAKYYPRPHIARIAVGGRGSMMETMPDGIQYGYDWQAEGFEPSAPYATKVVHQIHGPAPTLLTIWSPVILSVSISLMMLAAGWATRPRDGARHPAR